jgi:putative phosphoesterase
VIALLGDTHMPRGRRRLPDACLALLREASLVVHTGDFTAASVLEELQTLGPPVAAVHGNMDEWPLREILPRRLVVEAEGLRIGVVHDAGQGPAVARHARLGSWFPGCGLVVYGHSHQPEVAAVEGGWVVNPGSPTERRRAPAHTLAVVRDGVPELVEL